MAKKNLTDIERFWNHVEPQDNGCWLWTAAVVKGYPHFKVYPKMVKAHRFIWKHLHGPISSDLDVHHSCNNPLCVNPAHLELVTRKEHMMKSPNNITYANFSQTHCKKGHAFTPENTYVFRGMRHCRVCSRQRTREWQNSRKVG